MPMTSDQQKIAEIFFPYGNQKITDIKKSRFRFVHYTSAEAASSIIKNKQVWMRNTTTMSDFREVEHGFDCLRSAYKSPAGIAFKIELNKIFPDVSAEIEKRFDSWLPDIRINTYITCISEHHDAENEFGRLSMWRAYGRGKGVALVLNTQAFESESTALHIYSSPVSYSNAEDISRFFSTLAENIKYNAALIQAVGSQGIINLMFQVFRIAVICTKHPGFKEESEWRIIYSPTIEPSNRLIQSIESIDGVTQKIFKIPLKDIPEEGFVGAEIPKLLDRLIIGPTEYPEAMRQAFKELLVEAGVSNPDQKIYVSDIPLRT